MSAEALRCIHTTPPIISTMLTDPNAAEMLANALLEHFRMTEGGSDAIPLFFLVGSPRSSGDSLGPFVGWFLQRAGFNGLFLGDMQNPITATNLMEKRDVAHVLTWQNYGKRPYIVAVDAAVGDEIGRMSLYDGPLLARKRQLPPVGHVHIMGAVAKGYELLNVADVGLTVAMAEVIARALMQFWQEAAPDFRAVPEP